MDRSCEALMAQLPHYTRPILLQHFPLYRANDRGCQDRDGGPNSDGNRERWEVLSKGIVVRLATRNCDIPQMGAGRSFAGSKNCAA